MACGLLRCARPPNFAYPLIQHNNTFSDENSPRISSIGAHQLGVVDDSSQKCRATERHIEEISFKQLILQLVIGSAKAEDEVAGSFLHDVVFEAMDNELRDEMSVRAMPISYCEQMPMTAFK